jgi:lysophospholipase L1-like esterase
MRSVIPAMVLTMAAAGSALAQTPYVAQSLPAPGVSICAGGLCQPEALDSLFEALHGLESGERERLVRIVQIGDSHTAGDRITGAFRARMQTRFGRAGRGVMPPGVPHAGYNPFQVQVTATGWTTTLTPLTPPQGFAVQGVGLTGVQAVTFAPAAALEIVAEPGMELTYVSLCGMGGPDAGGFEVKGQWVREEVDFAAPEAGMLCVDAVIGALQERIVIRPLRGGAPLSDMTLGRAGHGVEVSNLGVVGASLRDLAARDEAVVTTQLAVWRPQLIVIAYGTNEGFDDALDPVAYEALLRGEVLRLRRLAPAAALMIVGAPDALRSGVAGGCSADGRRGPPPSLALVRDVQRRVAADMGVAFWDWHGRMGGDCSADRLATMDEPLMRGDRVHFTSAGGDWIGGIFADDVLAAYETWKARRGGAD